MKHHNNIKSLHISNLYKTDCVSLSTSLPVLFIFGEIEKKVTKYAFHEDFLEYFDRKLQCLGTFDY